MCSCAREYVCVCSRDTRTIGNQREEIYGEIEGNGERGDKKIKHII